MGSIGRILEGIFGENVLIAPRGSHMNMRRTQNPLEAVSTLTYTTTYNTWLASKTYGHQVYYGGTYQLGLLILGGLSLCNRGSFLNSVSPNSGLAFANYYSILG